MRANPRWIRRAATHGPLLGAAALVLACAGPGVAVDRDAHAEFVDLDGTRHTPLRVVSPDVHVLVFTTTDCPIANGYAPDITTMANLHGSDRVRFYLVHVDPDITAAAAREHANDFGYRMPVLLDVEHRLVEQTGVTMTPEVAVLTASGPVYRGRINDLYADLGHKRRTPRTHDLRDALAAVLAGEPVAAAQTTAIGCDIPEIF